MAAVRKTKRKVICNLTPRITKGDWTQREGSIFYGKRGGGYYFLCVCGEGRGFANQYLMEKEKITHAILCELTRKEIA